MAVAKGRTRRKQVTIRRHISLFSWLYHEHVISMLRCECHGTHADRRLGCMGDAHCTRPSVSHLGGNDATNVTHATRVQAKRTANISGFVSNSPLGQTSGIFRRRCSEYSAPFRLLASCLGYAVHAVFKRIRDDSRNRAILSSNLQCSSESCVAASVERSTQRTQNRGGCTSRVARKKVLIRLRRAV